MSFTTYSKFYYGHTVDEDNQAIDFSEGGDELRATLEIGDYTLTEYLAEVKRALEAAGTLTYSVIIDRATRLVTIAADGDFSLLVASGSRLGASAFAMLGFTGADRSGSSTYTGNAGSGSAFSPQFFLQDHLDPDNGNEAVESSVAESGSGRIQVMNFGSRRFLEANIRYQTNKASTGHIWIRLQQNGVENLRAFMNYATTKAPMEFIADEGSPSAFLSVMLESTPASKTGTGFKLTEMIKDKLPGYFETGVLKFRVLEGRR